VASIRQLAYDRRAYPLIVLDDEDGGHGATL